MNELQLKNLWTKLSDKFDIGDYETFKSKMLTKERRKAFYDKISEKFDIGSYDDFEIRLTSGSQPTQIPSELQLKNLWTKLSDKFDIGDYETFKSKMLTKERRKAFYDKISEKFDIGSYDDFEIRLTSGSQQSSLPSGSQPVSVGSQPVSVGSQPVSVGSQPTQIPSELKDIDGVKKFQDWLDIYHPGWHRKYGTLNKNLLRGYGKYGPNTTRAWNNQSYKDEYLKTSNSAATPSSESSSNWMDSFPSCVKGLKGFYNPPNNYFFGFGTDKEGAQYMIGYYSQKFNTGQRCEIYKDGSSVGIGFYSCTTNNQQIIIKTLSGLSITGSVINPDSKDITSPKNDDETLELSDDDVLKDNKVRVSKNTGI